MNKLNTQDLTLIHVILENRATDLQRYIKETDYAEKYGSDQAEAITQADLNYLADIRWTQTKINNLI